MLKGIGHSIVIRPERTAGYSPFTPKWHDTFGVEDFLYNFL